MRKVLFVASALVVGFGLTTAAVGAEKTMTAKKPMAAHETMAVKRTMVSRGTVVSVDAQKGSLVIKEQRGDVAFSLAKDVKIMSGHAVVGTSQLKAGEHVRVSYTTTGGQKTISQVVVWTGHPMHKSGSKKW